MFCYLRIPRQTCLFIACNIVLLARQMSVANGSCAENDLPTRMQIIRGNLNHLSDMFSEVFDRQIRISNDLTDAQIEDLFVRFAEVAPIQARDFLDLITTAYEGVMDTWLLRCKTQMPGKRGSAYQQVEKDQQNDVISSDDSYSTILQAIKRDPKHPLYRLPRSQTDL